MRSSRQRSAGNPTPFDPIEFYNLSKSLANNTDEACLRTAVGRAYYAIHLYAKSLPKIEAEIRTLANTQNTQNTLRSHEIVIQAVQNLETASTATATSEKFKALKRLRVTADYYMLPHSIGERDWSANYKRAQILADDLLVELYKL